MRGSYLKFSFPNLPKKVLRIASIAIFLLVLSSNAQASTCEELRYVFDFGSTILKSKGYLVNTCKNTIIKEFPEHKELLSIYSCFNDNNDTLGGDTFCLNSAINAINKIKKESNIDCKNNECFGIATAWARSIDNADALLSVINQQTGVDFSLISQKKEEQLVLNAAKKYSNSIFKDQSIIILNIKGGSFQLSGSNKNYQFFALYGTYGSEKTYIRLRKLFKLQNQSKAITQQSLKHALSHIRNIIKSEIENFTNPNIALKELSTAKAYASSGFIEYFIKYLLKSENAVVTPKIVMEILEESTIKTFNQMKQKYGDRYLPYDQAGMAILYILMEELNIKEIRYLKNDFRDILAIDRSILNSHYNED
jgi:exopolyphosphatase/pppGpp-phosphohydrolase